MRDKIFRSLKVSPKTVEELSVEINEHQSLVLNELNTLILEKWVERYGGKYRLRYVFGPKLKPAKKRDWSYEHIQKIQEEETQGSRPNEYMNTYTDWLPQLDQYARGTCCGFSGAYAAWLLQLRNLDIKPKKEDVQKIKYDQIVELETCKILVDEKHKWAPSPESVYQICRKLENVNFPSGCYLRGVARALKDWGYNFEKTWLTAKTSMCVHYPDEEITKKEAEEHKIEGYAQIWTWEGLKDAIYNNGCAIVAIDVFSNLEEHGKQGPFPEPNHDVVGSHALCAIGYDEKYVYVLHSWRSGWSKVGGFSENYYKKATGQAYSVLDTEDVIVALEEYGTVTVKTNVPCNISIGSDQYLNKQEVKVSWLLDKGCAVFAEPVTKNKYKELNFMDNVILTTDQRDVVLEYVFTEKDDLKYKIKKFIEGLLKKLSEILKK